MLPDGLDPLSNSGFSVPITDLGDRRRIDLGESRLPSRFGPLPTDMKEIEISDRETIRNKLLVFPQWTSELTFANLFAWAPTQYPRFKQVDNHLLVTYDPGNTGRDNVFLPPIGAKPLEVMERLMRTTGAKFVRVDHDLADRVSAEFLVEPSAADHDYLYDAKQVLALEGSQASELRRRGGKFVRNHGSELSNAPLSVANIPDAGIVADRWLEGRISATKDEEDKEGKRHDALACRRILERWAELPEMRGNVTYHRGQPIAVCIGELVEHPKAPSGLFISHFEKSLLTKEYEGLPVYAFQQMVRTLHPECIINRMQSAGNPGLEVWKRSWGPSGLGMKASLSPRK